MLGVSPTAALAASDEVLISIQIWASDGTNTIPGVDFVFYRDGIEAETLRTSRDWGAWYMESIAADQEIPEFSVRLMRAYEFELDDKIHPVELTAREGFENILYAEKTFMLVPDPDNVPNITPTASTVLVNGRNIAFQAYNIDGYNFFRLRDIAYVLNGTSAQFNISWIEDANTIALDTGQEYIAVGGELNISNTRSHTGASTTSTIILDGDEINFRAYLIGGNNYFRLRDLAAALSFDVMWDESAQTVLISTYGPD